MTYHRKNVWELGDDWAAEVLWYARGVKAMKARPDDLKDRLGWRFFGAMHGFDAYWWGQFGYYSNAGAMPSQSDIDTFWAQCQHGSWHFLPWHRGYLIAFEAAVRDEIRKLQGPYETWALPYWNYFRPGQNKLPPAFASAAWKDGADNNPLFVPQRYGPNDDGDVFVDRDQVNLDALGHHRFAGAATGGSPGFGGPRTGFHHARGAHGGLEDQPHDHVHGLVGGGDEQRFGLMSNPDTAGLDPIFWLHHANIDRLWEVWKQVPGSLGDPPEAAWVQGPAAQGQRAFVMPTPDGGTWTYTPGELSDLSKLDYDYDDVTPPALPSPMAGRLAMFGAPSAAAAARVEEALVMAGTPEVELLGAHSGEVPVTGREASATVALKREVQNKVAESFAAAAATALPDRVFLNLENVRGRNDAAILNVYVNVPKGQEPAKHPERKAGSVALFGVSSASQPDGGHAGEGLSFALEITRIVDQLHLQGDLAAGRLEVTLVPRRPLSEGAEIRVGRISVYRQSG